MDNILFMSLSPKGKKSFSYQIFESLEEDYGLKGKSIDGYSSLEEINTAIEKAKTVIISYPLYVDCLPAFTTKILEELRGVEGNKNLYVLVNCGFPEAYQNRVSIEIMKEFANQKGFDFRGSLSIGMGPMTSTLEKKSYMYRSIKKSLENFSRSIKENKEVELESEPSFGIFKGKVKYFLYSFIGNRMWDKLTKGKIDIRKKPYIFR